MPNIPGTQTGNTLNGSTTADSIVGFEGADSILANGGNDTIWAGQGNDTVSAGDGNDIIYGDQDRVATWGYRVYDRDFTSANGQAFTIESGTLRGSGLSTGFDVAGHALAARGTTGDPNDFGVIYTSTFTATTAGTYTFRTTSDDGSTMRLLDASGNPLVWSGQSTGQTGLTYLNNDFHQGATTRQASVTLAAGQTYTIELRFWENAGANTLTADVAPPGGGFQSLTNNTTFIGTGVYAGNDSLDGGTGNDLIYGEAGNDSISGGAGLDTLYGGTGNDTIRLGVDADADVAYGDDGADVIYTEHTSITVVDTVYGGAGNDTIYGGTGIDLLYGGADDDLILGAAGNDTVHGDAGNDQLYGDDGNDQIFGGIGNDSALGGAGNDTIYLGDGNDLQWAADTGDDLVYGGAGSDTLSGDLGNDTLYGDADNDFIEGHDGADTIYGGDGNDFLAGFDVVGLTGLTGPTLTPTVGSDDGSADLLDGGTGNDTMFGGGGNDTLIGGDGADTVYGGADNDTLVGNGGDDHLFGGDGADLIVTGNNNGAFAGSDDSAANVNYVEAGNGDDTILGSIARDQVFGDAGNDLIETFGGNDEVHGGTGNDTITGGVGNDRMMGGDGSDRFILDDNHDNDTIVGNEDSGDIDVIDATAVNGNLRVDVSSFEAGTISGAGLGTVFSEIERLELGSGNDSVRVASGADTIQLDGNAGIDNLFIGGTPILRGDVALDDTATGTFTPDNGAPAIPFGPAEALQLSDILATYYDGTISISGSTSLDGTIGSVAFEDFEELTFDIICFARGTRLRTDRGQRAIENLRAGDLVATLDHGLQPIRWIGSTTVPALGDLAPIVIRKGALGNRRDLRVSPQHRMLLRGWQAELMFGEDEVLVPAKSLLNDQSILRAQGGTVEYFHILFDSHEIVWAEGALSESFHPGQQGWKALDAATRSEILGLFPQLASSGLPAYGPAARPSLRDFEGRALRAAMGLA